MKSTVRSARSITLETLERERARIARELHAGAGQPLAGIRLNLGILDECRAALSERGRAALDRLHALADQAQQQIRSCSHGLNPPDWQALTLANALRELIDRSGLGVSMHVVVDLNTLPREPSHTAKIAFYRCAQECVSNIARHSGATRVGFSLMADGTVAKLCVKDNGRGFAIAVPNPGMGLRAMRECADLAGGDCKISSGKKGTKVTMRLSLDSQ